MLDVEPEACAHCLATSDTPLLHDLLDCPATARLRQSLGQHFPLSHDSEAVAVVVASPPLELLLVSAFIPTH